MKIKIGEQMIARNGSGLVIVVEQQGHTDFHWLYCCGLIVDAKDFVRYRKA